MFEIFGPSIWLLAVPPLIAIVAGVAFASAAHRRRDPAIRGVLIASLAVTGLEAIIIAAVVGFWFVFAAFGGMENF